MSKLKPIFERSTWLCVEPCGQVRRGDVSRCLDSRLRSPSVRDFRSSEKSSMLTRIWPKSKRKEIFGRGFTETSDHERAETFGLGVFLQFARSRQEH